MTDVRLFSLDSGAHHLVNVAFHLLSMILLFFFLRRATGAQWKSAFVALAFAIHPLHVESVAWVAERKDVLSGFFLVLSLGAYLSYGRHPSPVRYAWVLLAYSMAVMAKPTAVTFPLLMLLMDLWPLGRLRLPLRSVVWDKVPLLLIAGVGSILTFAAQKQSGAIAPTDLLPSAARLRNAALSYAGYVGQFLWPVKLSVFYPYVFGRPRWEEIASGLLILALSTSAAALIHRVPAVTVVWFWYVIGLVPMVGLIQAGAQAHADRYTYWPAVGLAMALAWGTGELARAGWLAAAAAGVGFAWAVMAWNYTKDWHDTQSLFTHAIAVGQYSVVARHQLGMALKQSGNLDQAIEQFENAVRLSPDSAEDRHTLGKTFLAAGRADAAALELRQAVRIAPNQALIHTDLATALLQSGKIPEALGEYALAVQCEPSADAHAGYGGALIGAGRISEGIGELAKSLPVLADRVVSNPDDPNAHYYLGTYYAYTEQVDKAIQEFSQVVWLRPRDVDGQFNLGVSLAASGRLPEAASALAAAVELDPGRARAHLFLGKCLAGLGRHEEAEAEFRAAVRLNPGLAGGEPFLERYLQ
jgi:protein O-mannosyl-transferase